MNFRRFCPPRARAGALDLVALRRGERGEPRLHARAADGADHRVEVVAHREAHGEQREVVVVDAERTLELDANLIETEEADGRECRHDGRPQAELRREYKREREDLDEKRSGRSSSNWQ